MISSRTSTGEITPGSSVSLARFSAGSYLATLQAILRTSSSGSGGAQRMFSTSNAASIAAGDMPLRLIAPPIAVRASFLLPDRIVPVIGALAVAVDCGNHSGAGAGFIAHGSDSSSQQYFCPDSWIDGSTTMY